MKGRVVAFSACAVALAMAAACGGAILLGDANGNGKQSTDGGGRGAVASEDAGVGTAPDVETNAVSDAGTPVKPVVSLPDGRTDSTPAVSGGPPCTNVQFNPRHCGACGHDCDGGECQGGTCVPLPSGVLASGQLTPSSIAVDDVNVYWVNESTTVEIGPITRAGDASFAGSGRTPTQIMMCAKSGCNNHPTVIASRSLDSEAYNNQRGFASDGINVYWEEGNANVGFPTGLFMCPVAGNGPVTELRQMYTFGDIALNANQVYAIGAVVFGADGKPAPVGGGTGVGSVGSWQVYGCSVAGCEDGTDAGPNVLWSTPQSPTIASVVGPAADTSNVYFASTLNGTILTCRLTGCGGSPTVLSTSSLLPDAGQLLPWQLTVDQANVYWDLTRYLPNLAGPAEGQLLGCAKTGCNGTPTVLASSLRNPVGLATDGANVYFAERGVAGTNGATDGRVSKCAVAGCSGQPIPIGVNLSYPHGVAVDASRVYWTDLGSAATVTANVIGVASVDGRIMVATK